MVQHCNCFLVFNFLILWLYHEDLIKPVCVCVVYPPLYNYDSKHDICIAVYMCTHCMYMYNSCLFSSFRIFAVLVMA